MELASPSFDERREQWELVLTRQRLLQLVPLLPYKTGRTWLTFEEQPFNGVFSFIMSQVRLNRFHNSLEVLIDILNQVMDETGWTIGTRPGCDDFSTLCAYIANPEQSFERVCESLTWVVVILECGLSYHLLKETGIPIEWDHMDLLRGHSVERAISLIYARTTAVPRLPVPAAEKLMRAMLRLTPPNLAHCIPKTPNSRIDYIQTMTMPLCRISQQLLDCLSTLNPCVFGDLPDKVVKIMFFDSASSSLKFDPFYRPLILSLDHYVVKDSARLLKTSSYFYSLRSDKHVEALAYVLLRCHNLFHVIKQAARTPESIERGHRVRMAAETVLEFHNQRSSGVDWSDVNMHMLITRSFIVSWQGDQWWKCSKRNAPPWRKYMTYYRGKINSSKLAESQAAITYLGHIAEHIYFVYCSGTQDEQSAALLEIYRELYTDAKAAIDRIMMEQVLPAALSHGILLGHIMFSTALPKLWYYDNFERPEAVRPPVMYMVLTSLSYRFNNNDPFLPAEFKTWGDKIVDAICYSLESAKVSGEHQSVFLESACVGLMFLRTASLDLGHLSTESKLKLCHTLISSSAKLSSRVRDYAMWTFVQVVTMFDDQALESLVAIHQLLCSMLEEAQPALLLPFLETKDPYGWNLQYIYDMLRARLYTSRKILKLDASRLAVNVALESKIRAGIVVMLCSVDKSLASKSLLCLQLLVDEISAWTNTRIPHDSFVQNSLYDQSVFQWLVTYGKTYLVHGFMMQNLIVKLGNVFANPQITDAFLEFTRAVSRQWLVFISSTTISVNMASRKTMINLMIFSSWLVPALVTRTSSSSPKVNGRLQLQEEASKHLVDIVDGVFSLQPHVRDASVVVTRSCVLPSPQVALTYLHIVCGSVLDRIAPVVKNKRVAIKVDETVFRQLVSFNACIGRYIQQACKTQNPPGFDIMEYHRKVLYTCQEFLFSETQDIHLVETFLSSLCISCSSLSLLVCSKFDALEEIVNMLTAKLQECPNTRHIKAFAQCLAAALEDYTCYSSGSYSMFDSRYSAFKSIILAINGAIMANEDTPAAENLKKCIVNLNLANQEMAVIFFEDGATMGRPYLKQGLYESFEITLVEDAEGCGVRRDEDIVNTLIKDSAVLHSICEVCPFDEARDTIQYLCTIFCEYSRGFELAQWAFLRDFEGAQYPHELFRRNSFHVQILLQVLNMELRPAFTKALRKAVGLVYREPFLFASEDAGGDAQRSEQVVVELLGTFIENKKDVFTPTVLKITKFIADKVDERFPGYLNTAFRNLIFLRVICPVLVLPYNFGIVAHIPEGAIRDGLLLFAKYLQRLDVDAGPSSLAIEKVRTLFEVLKTGPTGNYFFGFDQPSSRSVSTSFYGIHHFFYRHSREMQLQLQLYEGSANLSVEEQRHSQQPQLISSASSFNQLLLRLGRPTVTLYDGSGEGRKTKRSSGRKNSIPSWLSQDLQRVKLTDMDGVPHVRISALTVQGDTPTVDFFIEFNKRLDTILSLYPEKSFTLVVDCTWDKTSVDLAHHVDQAIFKACKDRGVTPQYTLLLNVSFWYTQSSIRKSSTMHLLNNRKILRTQTSLTVDENWAKLVGIPEESMLVIRDAKKAIKFEDVTFGHDGNDIKFTVYVGEQFVHISHYLHENVSTCDTFSLTEVRFINGAILLQRRYGSEKFELRLALNNATDLHRRLWHVLNTARSRYQGAGAAKPLLEVSVNKFYTYIMCQCLLDIPSKIAAINESASSLFPWILKKFKAGNQVDFSRLITSRQTVDVAAVAREVGLAFPDLVTDFIASFIEITSKSLFLTSDDVEIVKPWFEQMFAHKGQSAHFEVIVRSLLSMKIALEQKLGPEPTHRLLEPLGTAIMHNEQIVQTVLGLYLDCALYRAHVIKDDLACLVVRVPLSRAAIQHLLEIITELALESPEPANQFRWSGLPQWNRLQLVLMLLCSMKWQSTSQVLQLLPQLSTVIYIFSSVGGWQLRCHMHRLVNTVLDFLISAERSLDSEKTLRALKQTLNSDRGKLLWGVQCSMQDEIWDEGDAVQSESILKIAEFVRDILKAAVGTAQFKSDREMICKQFVSLHPSKLIPLRVWGFYGLLAFRGDEVGRLSMPWRVSQYPASKCYNSAHLVIILKAHATLIKRDINWADDHALGVNTWFALMWLLSGYQPIFTVGLDVLRCCVQHYLARASKRELRFADMMELSKPQNWREWWSKHSTLPLDLPEKGPLFGGRVINMLLPALCNDASAQAAIDTCESLLRAADSDPGFGSRICVALLVYVFDPNNRAFDELKGYGILQEETFDERDSSQSLQHKLTQEMCADHEAGVFSVVIVCSILLKRCSSASSGRFLNIVCQLPNEILQDVQPLIWPLCEKLFHLIEHDQIKDSINWYERLLVASENRTRPLSASLARLLQIVDRYGFPNMINENFQTVYDSRTLVGEFDESVVVLFRDLSNLLLPTTPYEDPY